MKTGIFSLKVAFGFSVSITKFWYLMSAWESSNFINKEYYFANMPAVQQDYQWVKQLKNRFLNVLLNVPFLSRSLGKTRKTFFFIYLVHREPKKICFPFEHHPDK